MTSSAPPPSSPGGMGWSRQMRDELGRLPETAANIREASENLKRVSGELVEVSAMLARIVRLMETAGVGEGLARIEKVSGDLEAVRRALTPPTSIEEARERLTQVEELVFGLGKGMLRSVGLTGQGRAHEGAAQRETARESDVPEDEGYTDEMS